MDRATPSPVPRRLVKTPSRDTLSPKGERVGLLWGRGHGSHLGGGANINHLV
jgi:hypothetical protein